MNHRLTVYFSVILLSITVPMFSAYGQSSCDNWRSPLEHNLSNNDVTSQFNNDPNKPHYGTDYRAADGDNVLSVADGTVLETGYNIKYLDKPNPRTGQMISGWGRYVVIKHTDGSTTLYAHLLEGSTYHLSIGMPVTRGTLIGRADSTGGVSGSHLHIEYSPNGKWMLKSSKVDPHPCLEGNPKIFSVSPNIGKHGSSLPITITGKNFINVTLVSFGTDIIVNSFTVNSETQITANITISAAAADGPRTVRVTNDIGTGELIDGFTVRMEVVWQETWPNYFQYSGPYYSIPNTQQDYYWYASANCVGWGCDFDMGNYVSFSINNGVATVSETMVNFASRYDYLRAYLITYFPPNIFLINDKGEHLKLSVQNFSANDKCFFSIQWIGGGAVAYGTGYASPSPIASSPDNRDLYLDSGGKYDSIKSLSLSCNSEWPEGGTKSITTGKIRFYYE